MNQDIGLARNIRYIACYRIHSFYSEFTYFLTYYRLMENSTLSQPWPAMLIVTATCPKLR